VDADRGRHARRQKSHMPVAAICVAIIADLVGSGALEDAVRVVGVAELALSLPIVTCAFEIVANGDVYQQIGLPRHADVADFEIGATVALTREHPLVSGGETSVVTNALQRPQYIVCAGPIREMLSFIEWFTPLAPTGKKKTRKPARHTILLKNSPNPRNVLGRGRRRSRGRQTHRRC
jgi:hypothetical protein